MRVLLVAVPIMHRLNGALEPIMVNELKWVPPMAVYLLAQIMRQEGHEVGILDLIAEQEIDEARLINRVAGYDVVGISANSINWPTARYIIEKIRQAHVRIPIILGGVHPTLYDDHLLHNYPIDFIIRGEGEQALPQLIEYLEGKKTVSAIAGLSYRDRRANLVRNPDSTPLSVAELENLPVPAYDLLPDGFYNGLTVESSRGCYFSCAFCSIPFRRSWRSLSPQAFASSVERLQPFAHKVNQNLFFLVDDCFTLNRKRALEIVRLIEERNLTFEASLAARCSDISDEEFALELKKISKLVLLGAECGYDEGLRRIGKGITVDTIEQSARLLHRAGFGHRAVFSFVICLPWETYEKVMQTVELGVSLAARYDAMIFLQWHSLFPGSTIWNQLKRKGEVDIGMYDDFGFFTHEYLVRKGIALSPAEIFRLEQKVAALRKFLEILKGNGLPIDKLVRFEVPLAILETEEYKKEKNREKKSQGRLRSRERFKTSAVSRMSRAAKRK